tara:strand:- start:713 stop:1387 length:675 start_codon:yes stop_codon:yes gene_type:complete
MNKPLFFALVFLLLNQYSFSQDIFDSLSKKLCECIEKEQVKNTDGIQPCFENLLVDNLIKIKEHYNAKTIDDIDMDDFGGKIGARMIKECEYVSDNFPSGVVGSEKKIEKQENLDCKSLKKGNFYYLTGRPNSKVMDTTFVTVSNNMFLERMKNGRTYSLLNINWKDDCKFDLIFKESNDPIKKNMSEPGEKYEYEILSNNEKSVFLKVLWGKIEHQFELFKID